MADLLEARCREAACQRVDLRGWALVAEAAVAVPGEAAATAALRVGETWARVATTGTAAKARVARVTAAAEVAARVPGRALGQKAEPAVLRVADRAAAAAASTAERLEREATLAAWADTRGTARACRRSGRTRSTPRAHHHWHRSRGWCLCRLRTGCSRQSRHRSPGGLGIAALEAVAREVAVTALAAQARAVAAAAVEALAKAAEAERATGMGITVATGEEMGEAGEAGLVARMAARQRPAVGLD